MIDLTGQRFGRLVALEFTEERRCGSVVWKCLCDCNKIHFVSSGNLCSGNVTSCGCLHSELISRRNSKHGMYGTSEYIAFRGMIQRCEDLKIPNYKDYGGRGISVSEEFHNFQIWYDYIGPRPGPEYSQDRIDNDGNYERGNIQWATKKEQNANSRPNSCGSNKQRWFRAWHKDMMCQFMSNNQNEFAKQHGLNAGCISGCLTGRLSQHKDWTFQRI